MTPLIFLAVSAILNIALDLFFVIVLKLGVEGAAIATVISQYLSGIGISIYSLIKNIQVRAITKLQYFHLKRVHKVISFSVLTCIQQSVMNLGILMVQGLVNSFGTVVMAAFAAAVKMMLLHICLCRTLEMHFRLLLLKTMVQKKKCVFNQD